MNTQPNNNSKTTPSNKGMKKNTGNNNPVATRLPKREPICMKTKPGEGKPSNLIVKCFDYVKVFNTKTKKDEMTERTTVIWVNQKGEYLESAAQNIWENCLKTWNPKQPVLLLPTDLIKPVLSVAKKIRFAVQNNLVVKDYVLEGKKVIDEARVKRNLNTEIYKNNIALQDMGFTITPTIKVNPNAGSSAAKYTEVSFEELSHQPRSNRKSA